MDAAILRHIATFIAVIHLHMPSKSMKLLLYLANAFINTFGITQPAPKAANRAAWFIAIMLLAVIATVATVAGFALHWFTHH
ncbi:MAG TPA: hypothetical protein VK608_09975 [Edaphobacter sp.]|nr:hypothetical protein [Edaphobacter sp.]